MIEEIKIKKINKRVHKWIIQCNIVVVLQVISTLICSYLHQLLLVQFINILYTASQKKSFIFTWYSHDPNGNQCINYQNLLHHCGRNRNDFFLFLLHICLKSSTSLKVEITTNIWLNAASFLVVKIHQTFLVNSRLWFLVKFSQRHLNLSFWSGKIFTT